MFPVELIPLTKDYALTGSKAILGRGADEDYVVLVHTLGPFEAEIVKAGFIRDVSGYDQTGVSQLSQQFVSYRRGDINLIVTVSHRFFDRTMFATRVATALKLEKKEDRIILFHMIRDATDSSRFY